MKILLLGYKGMLGDAIFQRFCEKYDLVGFDRDELDITNFEAVAKAVKNVRPALIINAAAYTDVDKAESEPQTAYAVNADACGNLALRAREIKARLIHFSTDYVFDGTSRDGYEESDVEHLHPLNVYGKSKLEGERLISEEINNFAIVRLSWLFGLNGKNFVNTMLDLALKKSAFKVVNDQFGKPTYTLDVADNLEQFFDDTKQGIFHLPNEGTTNWFNFALEIFKSAKIDVKVEPIPLSQYSRAAKVPKYSILNNTRLPKMRQWQEALADYLKNK